jgi:hypothetical protein
MYILLWLSFKFLSLLKELNGIEKLVKVAKKSNDKSKLVPIGDIFKCSLTMYMSRVVCVIIINANLQ